tara:strand:- start:321 stop:881 length:561 start_codon:yes stop_codon:yes gene_type:complete
MKLYTKTGDDGTTGLFGGPRVLKDHPRVCSYGSVDEFNASIGLAITSAESCHGVLKSWLIRLQSLLFDLGADLATPPKSSLEDRIRRIGSSDILQLEEWIDLSEKENNALNTFILPGGCELASRLHLARTICRRAERELVPLVAEGLASKETGIFLNRASDLLFSLARWANKKSGFGDTPWEKIEH